MKLYSTKLPLQVHTHRMSIKFWTLVESRKGYQTNVFHVYSEN